MSKFETKYPLSNSTYGKSITIKHFLNTKIKPKPYPYEDRILNSYPVYVRVSVKRQSTMLRSYIKEYVPVELYEEFIKKFSTDLEIEAIEIKKKIEKENPFENENFTLSNTFNGINSQKLSLSFVVSSTLKTEILKALADDFYRKILDNKDVLFNKDVLPGNDLLFSRLPTENANFFSRIERHKNASPMGQITLAAAEIMIQFSIVFEILPLQFFISFANNEFPESLKLWNKYPIDIWKIQDTIHYIQERTGHTLLVEDLSSGHFSELYLRVFQHDDELKDIQASIDILSSGCLALSNSERN